MSIAVSQKPSSQKTSFLYPIFYVHGFLVARLLKALLALLADAIRHLRESGKAENNPTKRHGRKLLALPRKSRRGPPLFAQVNHLPGRMNPRVPALK